MIVYVLLAGLGLLALLVFIFFPALRVAPFAYGSARLRAARARFMSKKELKNLAHLGYYDSLVAIDERLDLQLSKLAKESFPEEKVQRRIRRYRLECIKNIIHYTPVKYKEFFKVLLSKETLEFLIGAIRSKRNPTFSKEILKSMFTDERFSVEQFEELNLDELLQVLEKTPSGDIVAKYHDEILAGHLEAFEEELNMQYYARLSASANHPILKKCAKRIIDIHNIKQGLCLAPFKTVPGGSLSKEITDQLESATTVADVKAALESTYVAEFMTDKNTISELYQAMYQSLNAYANTLALQQPLSLNQMIAYYVNNIIEIKNIRILLKLSYEQFPPEKIEEAFL